jgi:FrmR/RcnR family transcriptional regulator, repressor of rcnA expression
VSHTKREKLKLLNRVRRVRGQVEAVERALEEEQGCAAVLHLIVAARGALNGLMTEVIEDHIRLHLVDGAKGSERARGAEELIEAHLPTLTAMCSWARATSATSAAPG